MLKGAIPEVEPFWALGSFEWAVRSVAYGAPLNNVSVDQFGHAAAERLLSIRSMIPHEQQTPATTPNAVTLQIPDLLPNEEQTCTVEDHRTNGIGGMGMKTHGTRHTDRDQMKKLFKGQSDARKKADQYLALTSADKKAHVARIRQLEIQLSEEQVARVDADRGITALSERNKYLQKRLDEANVAFAEAKKKLEIEITDARLQRQRVRAEQNRRIEAEKKLKEECARTEVRWQKARAFYTNQQELLEMQVADCTDEEKEAILREFQEDYGELGLK
ncbi:uncharacterized protein J4E88_009312 [Alternaria novae-zelandiae]|uniref:uncharacterized protein n=1 Tax=Alternaria novae-zelandiae TaxID=430562 RepID=UPI0020C581EF|nr:uncharacterized protein J4E88_009312 [Alternaria novae-zelandiae]KAI4671278.1 hypothetical protein J4E88_009312 [Alternaria novae-zelandiae]